MNHCYRITTKGRSFIEHAIDCPGRLWEWLCSFLETTDNDDTDYNEQGD